MRLLTSRQARELDHISMVDMGISGESLMGNAGKCISNRARTLMSDNKNPLILILCGKGNNGGDGFAAATELYHHKYIVHIHSTVGEEEIKGDSLQFYNYCNSLRVPITFGLVIPNMGTPDLIIDALIGTGLKGTLKDDFLNLINWANQKKTKIISVDIPSGLNSNSGTVNPISIMADDTITFGSPKLGMYFRNGPEFCGNIILEDIGFPKINITDLKGLKWRLFSEDIVKDSFNKPKLDIHKHASGKVLIIAGSLGMTGAAILATYGALRCGAGMTITTAPSSINDVYESSIIEGMTLPLDDNNSGFLKMSNFEQIMEKMNWADCVLLGPGLGRDALTQELIINLVKRIDKPLILDADGLFPFSNNLGPLNNREFPLVITPHFGELSRLIGIKTEIIISDFPKIMTDVMKTFKKTIVAKQVPVCVLERDEATVNISGNPGLATAGTGDVLAGIISGLCAQGMSCFNAASIGAFVHGKASDLVVAENGYKGQVASDLLSKIPDVLKQYERA
ncbi:MAG: NAD(P)H-hydrate dehydratase [bacterium TMED46]|nr:MAG: NAD(P)H-hydrate dehydratase [bacterium TMED46]